MQRLDEAQRYYRAGTAFCEPRELRWRTRCMDGAQADTLLLLGRWDEAVDLCNEVLAIPGVSASNQLYPLRILGTIRGRRGEPGYAELLDSSAARAAGIVSPGWVAQVRAVRAELLWVSGQADLACQEAREAYEQALGRVDPWKLGSLAIWLWRLGAGLDLPDGLPEPYALEIAGDWKGGAAAWERLGRTYDAALTRVVSSPDEAELRAALAVLDDLGARADRRRGQAADEGTRHDLDPARAPRGHPGRPGRAHRPRAGGPGAASLAACPTGRSPGGCSSPSGPCTTTSPRSWPRSVSHPVRPRPAKPPGWASPPDHGAPDHGPREHGRVPGHRPAVAR